MSPTGVQAIRARKLGVFLRDARQTKGKTLEDCAAAVGVAPDIYESYELGVQSPTLPEIEFLAYYLEVPPEHFWGDPTLLVAKSGKSALDIKRLAGVRQRLIGVTLRKARLDRGLSLVELAEVADVTSKELEAYELGQTAIPLPTLEVLSSKLGKSLKDFQDRHGPVGVWFMQQHAIEDFREMPADLQVFVSKPINRPYIELAQRLSEMSVDKLRSVAEGLLEITL